MSFSQDVKNEILRHRISKPCCSVAAAYAVACFGKYFDDRGIVLQTENEGVAAFAQKLYRRCGIRGDVLRKERPTGPVFEFSVKDVVEVERLLELFGHTGKEPTLRIRPENFKCQHCVQSFIAAAFLCCGTMTDPEKSYNLEFLSTRHYLSQQLEAMLAEHDFNPHRALRKGANTVYIKSADHIEDLLTFMGAGNAAMDVCRTALRHGTRHVECFSLSKKITASEYEASYAKLEGVNFHFNKKPVEITDKGVVFRDLNEAEDGTLTDIPGTEELYPSDSVIVSISQGPCTTITESEHDLKTNERGLFVTDELGHTSMPGVFASGDAVKGARTVVEAVAYSKKVAEAMHEYMQTLPPDLPDEYANVPVATYDDGN